MPGSAGMSTIAGTGTGTGGGKDDFPDPPFTKVVAFTGPNPRVGERCQGWELCGAAAKLVDGELGTTRPRMSVAPARPSRVACDGWSIHQRL